MLAVYASCNVNAENATEFKKLAKELIQATRHESGNISYHLIQGTDDSTLFAFIEQWKDKDALDAHMKTPHFTTIIPKIGTLTDGDMKITVHKLVI